MQVTIPDHLNIICEMVCGAKGLLQFSTVTGLRSGNVEFWLHGTEGTMHLDLNSGELRAGRHDSGRGLQLVEVDESDVGAWRVEEEFVEAIRGNEEVKLTTFEDGVRYMEFTDAVKRSLHSQQVETVNLHV